MLVKRAVTRGPGAPWKQLVLPDLKREERKQSTQDVINVSALGISVEGVELRIRTIHAWRFINTYNHVRDIAGMRQLMEAVLGAVKFAVKKKSGTERDHQGHSQ